MFVTMVIAALIVDGIFSVLGLIPTGPRPTRADIFSSITVNYKLALNVLGLAIFAALFWLTARRGATDPVCGMKVDRAKALTTESPAAPTTSARRNACTRSLRAESRMRVAARAPGASARRTPTTDHVAFEGTAWGGDRPNRRTRGRILTAAVGRRRIAHLQDTTIRAIQANLDVSRMWGMLETAPSGRCGCDAALCRSPTRRPGATAPSRPLPTT